MKFAFLGSTCEVIPTEIPTFETGKTGSYRGQSVHFRAAHTAPTPNKALAYRGHSYIA